MKLGDMVGVLTGTTLGTSAMSIIGSGAWGAAESLKGATQSFVGLGIMGSAAKLVPKNWFK